MTKRCIDVDPEAYFDSEDYLIHQEMLKEQEESASTSVTWYCPNGHNVFDSSDYAYDNPPECGGCGAIMTTNSSDYDDVHEMIEERGIREQTDCPG